MDMYDSLFSPGAMLNEQIARQVFDIAPETGPILVIIDKDGHFWPSDSERFSNLNVNESFLRQLCEKVDDGVEPAIAQTEHCCLIAKQLATEKTNCGYAVIALPPGDSKSIQCNIDLVDLVLNQIAMIAKLIEKNSLLYELQVKHFNGYQQGKAASN